MRVPGLLWPKFEDKTVGFKLAAIGSVNDRVINTMQLAGEVVLLMNDLYPDRVMEKYGIDDLTKPEEVFKAAAVKNGILLKGGEPDMQRAADLILTDLRSGKLGRITLEEPSL